MADALISPSVGCTMWAVSACTIAVCAKKVRVEMDDKKIPLMGVLGAFIFAAQMINFSIPATGSSGHIGGGMILSILLGPCAAFLTIASVLVIQALFFADGGLLALGCNIFNLGIFPAFIAYPLVYRPLVGNKPTQRKVTIAALASSIVALQMGAIGVLVETTASGISALPFLPFAALMLPIHFGIGIVEGMVTAAVVSFIFNARPEIVLGIQTQASRHGMALKTVGVIVLAFAVLTGGVVSWFASKNPDGLEWSIKEMTGSHEIHGYKSGLHDILAAIQKTVTVLPDYSFKKPETANKALMKLEGNNAPQSATVDAKAGTKKTENMFGTSVAGIVGGILTLSLTLLVGLILKKRSPLQSR